MLYELCRFVLKLFLFLGLISQEVRVGNFLEVGLLHLSMLAHLTMIDLTVQIVESIQVRDDLLLFIFTLTKSVLCLLNLSIREFFDLAARHATTLGLSTSGEGAGSFIHGTIQSYDSVAPVELVGHMTADVEILTHQGVPQGEEESILELLFVGPDKIVEALSILWAHELRLPLVLYLTTDLIETEKRGAADAMGTKELDALLSLLDRINDDVVKIRTSSGHGNVELVVNSAEITKPTVNAAQFALILCILQLSENPVARHHLLSSLPHVVDFVCDLTYLPLQLLVLFA